ncbi:hypothetical protein Mboo_0326 [Methanoregula boonei 6A8]|uniref:Uncharacterized protein n=1 Tax=Methanoregula boonei (strain DSM 21154 / JCM 14090 / 6A8) TaxID=456442 RepID=A7I537_METB6|nr:hypothetical protein Mboo_0326 [Methanoregula boonei 6A8]
MRVRCPFSAGNICGPGCRFLFFPCRQGHTCIRKSFFVFCGLKIHPGRDPVLGFLPDLSFFLDQVTYTRKGPGVPAGIGHARAMDPVTARKQFCADNHTGIRG